MITEISNFQNEIEVSDELISSIRMSVKQTLMSVAEKTDYEVSIALVDDSEIAELAAEYTSGDTDALLSEVEADIPELRNFFDLSKARVEVDRIRSVLAAVNIAALSHPSTDHDHLVN